MMEQQVLDLLAATLKPDEQTRTAAERQLELLHTSDAFPISLISLASYASVSKELRQAALYYLKTFILRTWSPSLEEFQGVVVLSDTIKHQVRQSLLELATNGTEERILVNAASYAVSKIASVDFPEAWPSLLQTLLQLIPTSSNDQLHAVLVVLGNLVEDGFDEEQFGQSAVELINCLFTIATDQNRKLTSRALAVSIFRACFDTIEMMYQNDQGSIQQFLQEAFDAWSPFFIDVIKAPLPQIPNDAEPDNSDSGSWRGLVALKTQVVKALDKIQNTFPHLLNPQILTLFSVTWESLQAHVRPYIAFYVENNSQGRLEDMDRLPYTLDFLVIEELDLIRGLLGTVTIKREMETQLAPENMSNGGVEGTWLAQVLGILVAYGQITQEDQGLWEIDVNVFLSEETSETANYSPRNACGALVQMLCRWPVLDSLLTHAKSIFQSESSSPQTKEAVLFLFMQILDEIHNGGDANVDPNIAQQYLDHIQVSVQDNDDILRARGLIAAAKVITIGSPGLLAVASELAQRTVTAIDQDPSEIVKVSCIRAMQDYYKVLPSPSARGLQIQTITALSNFLSSQDPSDLGESCEDMLITMVETLRDTIMAEPKICLDRGALDLLFTMASYGATSFQTTMMVTETFEAVTQAMVEEGAESYARLCAMVLPPLTGALDLGDLTSQNALSDMAVSLLSSLAECGPKPLPENFVATIMPKVYRLLFSSNEFNLIQSATITIRQILAHDPAQVFSWRDPATGKGGLEIILLIVDRLLGPEVDDASASEVGGLAMELVEKAGAEQLGPYLMQLLRVVAIRLSTAEHANFVQNLVLVFARLAITNAKEVLDFLAEVHVEGSAGGSGLEVVLRKWLEHSAHFAGYDAIRQNVMALTNIYKLHDDRLTNIQVQGDLIVDTSTKIKTRSQAKRAPDQYSIIPVPLKLTKVLIAELAASVSPSTPGLLPGQKNGANDDDDAEWEDEPSVVDLGSPTTRAELMGYADEARWNVRQADDETQAYLVQFFKEASQEPTFHMLYESLTEQEREKLQRMDQAATQP